MKLRTIDHHSSVKALREDDHYKLAFLDKGKQCLDHHPICQFAKTISLPVVKWRHYKCIITKFVFLFSQKMLTVELHSKSFPSIKTAFDLTFVGMPHPPPFSSLLSFF